jgi:chromosome partitioning protein
VRGTRSTDFVPPSMPRGVRAPEDEGRGLRASGDDQAGVEPERSATGADGTLGTRPAEDRLAGWPDRARREEPAVPEPPTAGEPRNPPTEEARELPPAAPGTAPRGGRVIAIANQKGGVGKSTTAVNVGASLAEAGRRVLVVDLDPQGNASTGLGVDHSERRVTTYDVLVGGVDIREAILETGVGGLYAVASTIDLAGAEIELVSQFSREGRLARALDPVRTEFDFVLLDCPPSLGLLTVNALTAATELLVPIQCEYYALEGLGQLLKNVRLVQQNVNPTLRLSGILMTMFDGRTKLSEQVVTEVRGYFGGRVYDAVIPRSVRLSEAPGYGKPITKYDPSSKGAMAYRRVAAEVLTRPAEDGLDAVADMVEGRLTPRERPAGRAQGGGGDPLGSRTDAGEAIGPPPNPEDVRGAPATAPPPDVESKEGHPQPSPEEAHAPHGRQVRVAEGGGA